MRKAAPFSLPILGAAMFLLGAQEHMTLVTGVAGSARVIDGDTLVIGGRRIRILGIGAPEPDLTCQDAARQTWKCGGDLRQVLAAPVARQVSCHVAGPDRYGRHLACYASRGSDLAEWLVREGWAVPAGDEQGRYRVAGREAEAKGTSMWHGSFTQMADRRRAGDRQHREGMDDER
ncbi:thermonuclease family protein [Paracoccus sp. SSK6]|uniref:thermonuclease family protein n=1 Tax=Paracoccus sp. SSK6 TaxID=3143131 RepID=UPI003219606F